MATTLITSLAAVRSVALVGGTSRFYDQKDSKSYEVETAPLALEQARWLEQLVLSHDVAKMDSFVDIEDDDFGNMQSVIIEGLTDDGKTIYTTTDFVGK